VCLARKGRNINGILGILCRQRYPGMVMFASVWQAAKSFEHY